MNIIKTYKGTIEIDKAFYEVFKECTSKDPSRMFMHNVYFDSEESTFVATDGRQLVTHKLRTSVEDAPEDSGFYELAKIGKTFKLIPIDEPGQFPNYKRVLPDESNYENVFPDNDYVQISGKLNLDSRFICQMIERTKCYFNIEYLIKVLKHVPGFNMYCDMENQNRVLLFRIDDYTDYIVMPLQKD